MIADYGVGIDCHSRFVQICVLVYDQTTHSVKRFEQDFGTTWQELCLAREYITATLSSLLEKPPDEGELTYCIESTGCYHIPVTLCLGGKTMLVNPLLANPSRRKTDKLDARLLAHHAITGLWPLSYLATLDVQCVRVMVRYRRRLLQARIRITNYLNNVVLRFGHTFAGQDDTPIHASSKWPIVEALSEGKLPNVPGVGPIRIPEVVRPPMKEAIATADKLHKDIVTQTRRILKATQKAEFVCGGGEIVLGEKLIPRLKTVPGVGDLTACIWLSEIGDATRFRWPEQAAAICGYDPSLKVSAGQVTAQTRRRGNKTLHYIIGQAAGRVIKDRKEPLGQWGYSIQKRFRTGGQKKACGAEVGGCNVGCPPRSGGFQLRQLLFLARAGGAARSSQRDGFWRTDAEAADRAWLRHVGGTRCGFHDGGARHQERSWTEMSRLAKSMDRAKSGIFVRGKVVRRTKREVGTEKKRPLRIGLRPMDFLELAIEE